MSWLFLQFIIISLVPLSFLALLGYVVLRHSGNRPLVVRWWGITMVLVALWSSRQLTPYLGVEAGQLLPYFWRAFANYPLVLAGTGFLLSTAFFVSQHPGRWRSIMLAGPILAVIAFLIDPALWPARLPTLVVGQLVLGQFELWAVIWVSAWLLPAASAWLMAEQAVRSAPASIYRNQVFYWLIIMSVIFVGGTMGLMRDMLVVQQAGAIVLLVGMFVGSLAIVRSRLPNLPETARRLTFHLLRSVIVFVLSAAVLYGLTLFLLNTSDTPATIMITAALLTLVLLGVIYVINWMLKAIFLKEEEEPPLSLALEPIQNGLLPPADVATHLLDEIIRELDAAGGWLAVAEEGHAGGLILRPLAGETAPRPISLSGVSPFVNHLHDEKSPLTRDDINYLPAFAEMPEVERDMHQSWGMTAYIPLYAQERLIALVALKGRRTGERYTAADVARMKLLGQTLGPLISRSQTVAALRQAAETTQIQNAVLVQEWQRLKELVDFHQQFIHLLSPDQLRQPFTDLSHQLQQLEQELGGRLNGSGEKLTAIQAQVDESQARVDNLIAVAAHLEKQGQFDLSPVYMDGVLRSVLLNLEDMAKARQIEPELHVRGQILPVLGDRERLEEALQQLLHNAIKFNRIGGKIEIQCQMQRDEVRIEIRDEGVGIPAERLETLWRGLERTPTLERLGGRRRTRIGLPLVSFIIKAHGGRVDVESRYGRGSTFRVYLPARVAVD